MDTKADPLKCQVCQEAYKDPFLLPCLHSFCKKCLITEMGQQSDSEGKLKCPTCKSGFVIPSGGISGFTQNFSLARQVEMSTYEKKFSSGGEIPCDRCAKQANGYAVVFCCQCCFFLCLSCKENHQSWRQMMDHELVEVGEEKIQDNKLPKIPQKPIYCSQHNDEKLKCYCQECEVLTCRDCWMYSHKDHTNRPYTEIIDQVSAEIRESLNSCEEVVNKLEEAELKFNNLKIRIKSHKKEVEDEVNKVFTALSKAVKDRWEAVLSECEMVQESKISVIDAQIEEFHKLKEAYEYSKSALKTHESFELLASKRLFKDRLNQCLQSCKQELAGPKEDDFIIASLEDAELLKSIEEFGLVTGKDFSKSYLDTGIAIASATVNTERKFSLLLRDSKGNPVSEQAISVTAALEEVTNGKKTSVAIAINEDVASLSCFPTTEGEYKLRVTVGGIGAQHSPYSLWVKQPKNLSSLNNSCTKSFAVGKNTNGVAVHSNGDVYVSDTQCYINIFDEAGSRKSTIGSPGREQAQFQNPFGLTIYNGVLYVVDQRNNRIQKFSLSGEYIGEFGSNGSGESQLSGPQGISHDGKGNILVADSNSRKVKVFTTEGSFVKAIQCSGTPSDVAVDNDGNIHATIRNQNNVQVFSPSGVGIKVYSNTRGYFQNPQGIAIDNRGYSFITAQYYQSNTTYYYLHILDTNGQQLNLLSSFNQPMGVALDKHSSIYIADNANHRVLQY